MANEIKITVPDIGGATNVDVIEVMVKPGDHIAKEASLITLESDKASMEIPSPHEGVVKAISIKVGDKVSQGSLILTLEAAETSAPTKDEQPPATSKTAPPEAEQAPLAAAASEKATKPPTASPSTPESNARVYAGPAIRRIAREFGVDLTKVTGSGRKSRILKEDLQQYVKSRLANNTFATGLNIPAAAKIDFSQFGAIEIKPLNKIKRLTGANVHRAWVSIPHVTQFDEVDITDLEAFREQHKARAEREGYKLTPLAFITRAVVKALQKYPQFNASLDETGENLIYKKYYNIGIAVETPNGLIVAVLRDVESKNISTIAKDMALLSTKARDKGLMPQEMTGNCFTISSLGGIGGTAFTPIVNSPDVAILGVSKAKLKPVYIKDKLVPRLILPLSLSYDHRVIDGAEAARFSNYLSECLSDLRTILL